MITVVEYLVIAAVVGAVVFGIAIFVFGRGEQMAPLPARTSPAELPAGNVSGGHVRTLRFALALRGYRMSDVDWALDRLADEIDALRERLGEADGGIADPQNPGSAVAAASSAAGDAAGDPSDGEPRDQAASLAGSPNGDTADDWRPERTAQ